MSIELIKFINNADCKNILVVGVVHGDEPQGEVLIRQYIKNHAKINPAPKNNFYLIPRLNPSNTRKNLNGVDINRNFPTKNWELSDKKSDYFGGLAPNSEAETKFIVNLMENIEFSAIVTIHAPYKVVNFDGEGKALAQKIADILNYPISSDIGYPTPGSFGTYSGVERKIPTITIELDENTPHEKLYPKFEEIFKYLECEL